MRLGVDLLALQSGGSRDRGVGRYAAALLAALGRRCGPADEFVLYRYRDLPIDRLPALDGPRVRVEPVGDDEGDASVRGRWEAIAAHNPDRLDALLLLNPFELAPGFEPPPRSPGGVPIVAVLYDLIPMRLPEAYLNDPGVRSRYHRRLDTLRRYDRFLAISESTRRDAVGLLGLRADRVTALPLAADPRFRPADPDGGDDPTDAEALAALGVAPPFVLHVGGRDDRKNVRGVIAAFAGLDPTRREATRLVALGAYDAAYRERVAAEAARRGVGDRLVLPEAVDDRALEALYRRCAAFVFPSEYEGLGLPILEAMRSGAAVIAGRNSSQVDLVGDAGILVDPSDAAGMARELGRLLADREHAEALGRAAIERVALLCRGDLGRAAHDVIAGLVAPRMPGPHFRRPAARPRVGIASPFPPKETGIADYAGRLAEALDAHFAVDLYHDGDYVPELGLRDRRFRCVDRAVFARRVGVLPHGAVIYQMGNSWYHRSVYELLREHPGITVLHDFNLAGFHYWYGHQAGVAEGHFERLVALERRAGAIGPDEDVEAWKAEPGGVQGAATRRGVAMNREIFERSRVVVVHSPYCRELVRRSLPEYLDRTVVVPMGAAPNLRPPEQVAAIRRRFGIPAGAVVFGCFGNLTSMKMYEEAIRAFASIRRRAGHAVLLFVGKDWEGGRARALCRAEGLSDRAIFLGKASRPDYEGLVAAVDVGLGLRRPPTYGETSASLLDFLRSGVPAIVTDVASFRDYPPGVVVPWDPDRDGEAGLADRMLALALDGPARRELGRAALSYVRERHAWPIAARAFAELVTRCADGDAPAPPIADRIATHPTGGNRR